MITLHVHNVKTYFASDTDDGTSVANRLKKYLRYENAAYHWQNSEYTSQYVSLVKKDRHGYHTLTGLLDLVIHILQILKYDYIINDLQTQVSLPDEDLICRRFDRLAYTPRPYQEEAIFTGLKFKRGMFNLCTGAGKTLVMGAMASIWRQKTLVVCDSTDLAGQLQEEISEIIKEPVGFIGAGKFNIERVSVGMVSTLTNKSSGAKKKAALKEYLSSVEHLMFDEVHHSQAATWQKVSTLCTGASLRHGFSGTCFTPEEEMEDGSVKNTKDLLLVGHTGRIITNVRTADLVEAGYLSRPIVYMIKNHVYNDGAKRTWMADYEKVIVNDAERNDIVAAIIKQEYDVEEQTIVFVDRIAHGEAIRDIGTDVYGIPHKEIEFVKGEDHRKRRSDLITGFKEKELSCLIGTILGEGLNFFAKAGVNAAGGKSKKNVIQRIGRVLRKERDPELGDVDPTTERVVKYFDFLDEGHMLFGSQGRERYKIYKEEGHEIRVIRIFRGKVLKSDIDSLPIRGENLSKLYSIFESAYKGAVGPWKWETGEKPRVKEAFSNLCEAFMFRKGSETDLAMEHWALYLAQQLQAWLRWDKATRSNFVGFMVKKDSIEIYAAKLGVDNEAEISIAGFDKGDWEI